MWDRENDDTLEINRKLDEAPAVHRILLPGDRVGPYRIVREIGRGGMAEVYHAARADDQFDQQVALKVLQPERVGPMTIRRFEQERQIVASLSHPNIAGLLDGGMTDDGRPYFAMELVEGRPLDEYCDHHRLSVAERLRLFVTVGRAVHYAHQNLWVHRDLKPGNILVTDDGQVKLLDFGIAKLIEDDAVSPDRRHTLVQSAHRTSLWMTPQYASPEQLEGRPVHTAADQYQLGLILFEILTGRLPYDLARAPLVEVIDVVCRKEAPSPSAVVTKPLHEYRPTATSSKVVASKSVASKSPPSTVTADPGNPADPGAAPEAPAAKSERSDDDRTDDDRTEAERAPIRLPSAEDLAGFRHTTPRRLRRRLKGDLDAVTLRSLRKDPKARYSSVEQMLRDIERHLEGRAVSVRSGVTYRSRRFLRRHRWGAAALALFLAGWIVYGITVTRQSRRIAEERDRARLAAAEAEQVKSFLVDLFELADPNENLGEEITVRRLLDRGAREIESELRDQPAVRAEMLHVIGRVYHRLGDYHRAQPLLTEALEVRRKLYGGEHLDVAQTLNDLAMLYRELGSYRRSESVHREVLRIRRELLGEAHPKVAGTLHNLARVLELQAAFDEAEQHFREALAMDRKIHGTDLHRDVSYDLNSLGELLVTVGRLDEAEELLSQALVVRRRLYGGEHPTVAKSLRGLARVARARGRPGEAARRASASHAVHSKVYGELHKETATDRMEIALSALDAGHTEAAERDLRAAIETFTRSLGERHPHTLLARAALGEVLARLDRADEGLTHFADILDHVPSRIPPRHPDTAAVYRCYGITLIAAGRPREARAALAEGLEIRRRVFGDEHPWTRELRATLDEIQFTDDDEAVSSMR